MYSRLVLYLTAAIILRVQGKAIDTENADEDEGYFWRDFHGRIPHDALKAGKDSLGKSIYIGQVLHNGILIPGKISEGEQELSFEWGKSEHKSNKNVKILSATHPEQYEWIKSDTKGIKNLDKKCITGGYEPGNGEITYIGKTTSDGADAVGKVLVNDNEFAGLHTTKEGVGVQSTEFEVLTYNPEIAIVPLINKATETTELPEKKKDSHDISLDSACGPRVININLD